MTDYPRRLIVWLDCNGEELPFPIDHRCVIHYYPRQVKDVESKLWRKYMRLHASRHKINDDDAVIVRKLRDLVEQMRKDTKW